MTLTPEVPTFFGTRVGTTSVIISIKFLNMSTETTVGKSWIADLSLDLCMWQTYNKYNTFGKIYLHDFYIILRDVGSNLDVILDTFWQHWLQQGANMWYRK